MSTVNRREFIKNTLAASAGAAMSPLFSIEKSGSPRNIKITKVSSNFEREPLIRPFGFKGGYMKEIWQSAAYLGSDSGNHSIGLCSQSVLWSDAGVFASHSEAGGNSMMYAMTERALQMINGEIFSSPVDLLDALYPEIWEYGKSITSNPLLRKTFALNALVAVDNAAWLLYARENGISSFDEMIPGKYRKALAMKHAGAAAIPLMAYAIPVSEIRDAIDQGYFFMKVKIGQPGTQDEMLEKDKARISEIHKTIGDVRTIHTKNGKLPYYFDANGRYEKKDTLLKLIDHCRKIGAFDQIMIIEEPFPEEYEADVSDIPVRLASDESAHTEEDAVTRMKMGYKAIALKAIAKTLSMTLKIASAAHERNVPCFCADLTVNPILVEWNKNVAARLDPFPGIGSIGLVESNGHQNYRNWETMMSYHPRKDAGWVHVNKGVYEFGDEFYRTGGGIFDQSPHYEEMFS
jgi:L-alanine-DL-glutamate epimerase-like enolase superfamily enzyme